MTNSSQTVTGTLTLDGFGQTVTSTGSSTNPYMFGATSGYRTEGDAGLMKVGARYYDAQVGRFITRDTVLTEHPYLYCDSDPINYVDPSGHWKVPGWVRGAVVGCVVYGLVILAGGILFPVAAGGVIGGFAIGAIGGALGGMAGYGYGVDDPNDITWPHLGTAAGGGAITGGFGGIITGVKAMPWLQKYLTYLRPTISPTSDANLFRINSVIKGLDQ